jgi:hypothetical protein
VNGAGAVRVLDWAVTKKSADLLRLADHIFFTEFHAYGLYDKVSHAFTVVDDFKLWLAKLPLASPLAQLALQYATVRCAWDRSHEQNRRRATSP